MNNASNNSTLKTMTVKDIKKETEKSKVVKILVQIVTYVFLFAIALIVLFPFYWMIASSLKSKTEYYLNPTNFLQTTSSDTSSINQRTDSRGRLSLQ